MTEPIEECDFLVIGGGPAGQKAALHAAEAGKRVVLVDEEPGVGGACVRRGTIPSKTLRETALALVRLSDKTGGVLSSQLPKERELDSLMARKHEVIAAHERFLREQLVRGGVDVVHGRARFASPHDVFVRTPQRTARVFTAAKIVIATGSRPRTPPEIPVDHEWILDSDSILSMVYLPSSLIVLGAGVIASEYASIFQALGVRVTMIDRGARPLQFLDAELTAGFVSSFSAAGGAFLGERTVQRVSTDGASQVKVELAGGEVLVAEKLLCTLGRVANVEHLHLQHAGVPLSSRGLIEVDAHCRTAVGHIYAVGDVIGPPALASTSMEQGRRAMRHALGEPIKPGSAEIVPVGVYTIPEMACVGLSEQQARERFGDVLVGRARFDEIARGVIACAREGLLKLVCTPDGGRVLGVHIVGEGACELVHVGQVAAIAGLGARTFVENAMNFPTLAEAYRVAALDALSRVDQRAAVPQPTFLAAPL